MSRNQTARKPTAGLVSRLTRRNRSGPAMHSAIPLTMNDARLGSWVSSTTPAISHGKSG